jgi:hypothetical protein
MGLTQARSPTGTGARFCIVTLISFEVVAEGGTRSSADYRKNRQSPSVMPVHLNGGGERASSQWQPFTARVAPQ